MLNKILIIYFYRDIYVMKVACLPVTRLATNKTERPLWKGLCRVYSYCHSNGERSCRETAISRSPFDKKIIFQKEK